nr:5-formyltetrahydrofolate cyclo-ligase [Solimonas marina]
MRREIRARRLRVSAAQRRRAAIAAAQYALQLITQRRARRVALYLAYGSELPTAPLIQRLQQHGLRIAVPRITAPGVMHFEWLRAGAPMRRNRLGIEEPATRGSRAHRAELDVVILPLVGFDLRGNRLGNGGGFYDRWLARPRIAQRPRYLGYAYALQQAEHLPREPWDIRLDAIITEQGTRWPTG